ncbi:hypothetical protein PGTUg99_001829 [Puccinia graminis f. sp. tritici]|uniref:Uncharacterized protein n=1 Tax=Puccinia graminis f. sp. tritici TaxID=56615 RepID=A0A5B0NR90_PUCGR|nr:hypothetical protein PGTUg99_001829 [Puccinia graminis f. sp. tritici]
MLTRMFRNMILENQWQALVSAAQSCRASVLGYRIFGWSLFLRATRNENLRRYPSCSSVKSCFFPSTPSPHKGSQIGFHLMFMINPPFSQEKLFLMSGSVRKASGGIKPT